MEGLYAVLAFLLGFLVAQTWKLIVGIFSGYRTREVVNFQTAIGYFSRSGGMPSGHAAGFTSMSVYLGMLYGFSSGIFALAICVWAVIVYDAIHVRYAVGEQGKALNGLLKEAGKSELPIVEGHTVAQVAVGTILGVVIGVGVFWFIN